MSLQRRVEAPISDRGVKFTALASQDQTTLTAPAVSGTWWDPQGTTSLSTLGTLLCSPHKVVLETMWKSENIMLQVKSTPDRCTPDRGVSEMDMSSFDANTDVATGRVLGKHCGSDLPASVDTSDSFAFVKFVSDASGNAAGFSLSFEASVEGTVNVYRTFSQLITDAMRRSTSRMAFRGVHDISSQAFHSVIN